MPRRDRNCYTGLRGDDFGTSERANAYGMDESGVTPTYDGDVDIYGERDENPSQNPIAAFIMWLMRCFGFGTNDKSSGGGGIPEITKDKEILKLYEMFIKQQKEGSDTCPRKTKLNTAAVRKFLGITGGRKTRRRRNKTRRRRSRDRS